MLCLRSRPTGSTLRTQSKRSSIIPSSDSLVVIAHPSLSFASPAGNYRASAILHLPSRCRRMSAQQHGPTVGFRYASPPSTRSSSSPQTSNDRFPEGRPPTPTRLKRALACCLRDSFLAVSSVRTFLGVLPDRRGRAVDRDSDRQVDFCDGPSVDKPASAR